MTSKFVKGYIVGLVTGVVFRDPIVRGVRKFADAANAKAEAMEEKVEKEAPESYPGSDSDKPSSSRPAAGSILPSARIEEINTSSPDNPVYLTEDEVATLAAHNLSYLRVALGSKRLLIRGINDGHLAT